MSKKSLKSRFGLTVVLPILLALLAASVAAFYSARHEIEEVYDAQLAHTARIMLALMRHEVDEGEPDMTALQERFGEVGHAYEKHIGVRIWKGEQLFYESPSAVNFGPQHVIAGFSNKEVQGESWRFFVLPDRVSGLTVEAAENYRIRLDIMNKIMLSMFTPALLLLLIIPPLFWIGLRQGLKPLVRLSEAVGVRSPEDLTEISEDRTPSEILPLARAINRLLVRLSGALVKERRFTDLAAHELKTPLAVIKTLAQSAARARDESERRQLLGDLNIATDRATAMTGQLLALARLDHERLVPEEVSLNQIARQAVSELAPLARDKGLAVIIEGRETLNVRANHDMLLLAVRNLLENAVKYTPSGGRIVISVAQDAQSCFLKISDTGPGIPEDKLVQVTEPFYRIPGNRAPGSGLGLAAVTRVAQLLGVQFTLSNHPQGGVIAEFRFDCAR